MCTICYLQSFDLKAAGEFFAVEVAQEAAQEQAKSWKTYLAILDAMLVIWLKVDEHESLQ
jgi:hypothetical protein